MYRPPRLAADRFRAILRITLPALAHTRRVWAWEPPFQCHTLTRNVAKPEWQKAARWPPSENLLAPQPQFGDDAAIAFDVLAIQVVQQTTPLTNHHQQAATAVMIVFVLAEMIRQVVDPLAEQSHLNLGRAGVAVMRTVFSDDLLCGFHSSTCVFVHGRS